tara:strand:- start:1590 stop:1790 length:201 start_codon:yes stop_codon:yes gene_type:complete
MKTLKQQIKKTIKKEERSLEKEHGVLGDIQRITSSSDSENQFYMEGYVAGLERALRFIREHNSSKR